jgi:hypothetical protein
LHSILHLLITSSLFSPNILLSTLFSMFLSSCQKPSFTTIQNNRHNCSKCNCNFYVLWQQTRRQTILDWMAVSISRIHFPLNFLWNQILTWYCHSWIFKPWHSLGEYARAIYWEMRK